MTVLVVVLVGLAGFLVGGALSLRRQGSPTRVVVLLAALAALLVVLAVVLGVSR